MFLFPYVGAVLQIPMIDVARVFASHGTKSNPNTVFNDNGCFPRCVQENMGKYKPREKIQGKCRWKKLQRGQRVTS